MLSVNEINKILEEYDGTDFKTTQVALATVTHVKGSSYRREGARMMVTNDGRWCGGISGGCLEGDALQKAQKAIFNQQPHKVTYNTQDDDPFQIGVGLGCRGIIDVFLEPVNPDDPLNPIQLLRELMGSREPVAFATIIQSSEKSLIGKRLIPHKNATIQSSLLDNSYIPELKSMAEEVLENGKSKVFVNNDPVLQEVFVEVIDPTVELYLFGHNNDIFPLIKIANTLGWNPNVIADIRKLSKAVFESAKVWSNVPFRKGEKDLPVSFDNYGAAVLMSHDYATDLAVIKRLLGEKVPYIGILGPKSRTSNLIEDLLKEVIGLNDNDLGRIFGPVGLDIGAATPESIALSIAAEIQAFFGKRSGGSLRERSSPIYESGR
jgi:xanthine dehydrogenase accessory factor